MRFEVSERIRTDRSEQEIFSELMEQFKKVSRTMETGHQSFKAIDIEATFGSINRHDETTVQMKRMGDGWLLVADVLYRPSIAFWVILIITLFSWVGWLVPLGFYLYQKKTVRAGIESCFARMRNEFEQPASSGTTHLDSALESIAKLGALRDKGLISAEEYERKKKSLLGESPSPATTAIPEARKVAPASSPAPSFSAQERQHDFRQTEPHAKPSVIPSAIPPGIKGWSWGAFLLNFVWAIGNKTWIGLLVFIPIVGLPMPFILGFKGREWAWKNKQWDSVEHFNRVQRKWSRWGLGYAVLVLTAFGIGLAIHAYRENPQWNAFGTESEKAVAATTQTEDLELETDPGLSNPAPVNVAEPGQIDVTASLPTQVHTAGGSLELIRPEGGDKALYLNRQKLFTGEDAKWHLIVRPFRLSSGEDAVLMASSGGRGTSCETLFFFLVIGRTGANYTPEFGSCANRLTYVKTGDTIRMRVPVMGGESEYVFDGETLTENGRKVAMSDDIDPSK